MNKIQKFKSYMLRTCKNDMTAHGGFVWPQNGHVKCPDWNSEKQCGHGLHGLLLGSGDASLMNWDEDAKWLVVGINEWVDLGQKVKAPEGVVVYCGKRDGAIKYLKTHGADPSVMVYGQATASGDYGQATASGLNGQATVGIGGKAAANELGIIVIKWWDKKNTRLRIAVGYVGEGIEAGRYYKVDNGELIPTDEFIHVEDAA